MATVKTWGERLFYDKELYGRKGRQPKNEGLNASNARGGSKRGTKNASYYRARFAALVDKHPQVNVKITGGNKSLDGFVAHVNYINHNGKEELENENGEIFQGKLSAKELQALWGGDLSTNETGTNKYRENFHIVFSMPPNTDRNKFSIAARRTVHELFTDNHHFLMAEHRNTEHPHLHVVVKAVGKDGQRLNPKKADLRYWRETFAENLRAQGIKAEATSRQIRGNYRKGVNTKIAQMKRNGKEPDTEHAWKESIYAQVQAGKSYNHSKALQKAKSTRAVVLTMYNAMIKDLERSEFDADKKLAMKLRVFVDNMPRIDSREKVIYEEHRKSLEQAKAMQVKLANQKEIKSVDEKLTVQPKTRHKPKI